MKSEWDLGGCLNELSYGLNKRNEHNEPYIEVDPTRPRERPAPEKEVDPKGSYPSDTPLACVELLAAKAVAVLMSRSWPKQSRAFGSKLGGASEWTLMVKWSS